jgi:hypothetical protein
MGGAAAFRRAPLSVRGDSLSHFSRITPRTLCISSFELRTIRPMPEKIANSTHLRISLLALA